MNKNTIHRIYKVQCYDEDEDDPWQFLDSVKQDVLPSTTKPLRVKACKQILADTTPRSWYGQVATDPCYSLLPKTASTTRKATTSADPHGGNSPAFVPAASGSNDIEAAMVKREKRT